MCSELIKLTKEYDRIIVIDDIDTHVLMDKFLSSGAFHNCKKKIAVLLADECRDLYSLYKTYEFTDQIVILGRSKQFGGLMNLVDAGLLTEEQVFDAILR